MPPDFDADEIQLVKAVRPYTMTTPERVVMLARAVAYLVANGIAGDIVECGVWKGGSMIAAARTLMRMGDTGRHLWLYDTYAGMPAPTEKDVTLLDEPAHQVLVTQPDVYECYAGLDEVKRNVLGSGYDRALIHFVPGKVEETIPGQAPEAIALLRLDTDFYESTVHELVHLFPRVSRGGVVLIDDYGHWKGARRATDEYFSSRKIPFLLSRVDYSARIGVKL
jgi:hypothetical protein